MYLDVHLHNAFQLGFMTIFIELRVSALKENLDSTSGAGLLAIVSLSQSYDGVILISCFSAGLKKHDRAQLVLAWIFFIQHGED